MEKFAKYLANGLAIAVLASLVICYAVWSIHSLHRLIWLFIVFVAGCCVCFYTASPHTKKYKDKDGYPQTRPMTKWESFLVIMQAIIWVVIIGAIFGAIGYGVACIFGIHPNLWEMYILYGLLSILAVWWFIDIIMHYITTDEVGKKVCRAFFAKTIMWIIVIASSLAAGGAILYFLLPIVAHC